MQISSPTKDYPSISISNLFGDGTCLVHVQDNTTFYIEYNSVATRRSISKTDYLIERNAVLYFPTDFIVMGGGTPAVTLKGTIIGVLNFTVAEGRRIVIGQYGKTLPPPSKNGSQSSRGYGIEIGVWTQEANGQLLFSDTGNGVVNSSDFILRSGATFEAKVRVMTSIYKALPLDFGLTFCDVLN